MHLISSYSCSSGLKIDSPYILESYFPMVFDKYLIIHGSSGMIAKNFSYYNEVISLIRPTLVENGYEIVQLGTAEDPGIVNTVNLLGKTNIHQSAYLINRAALFIGNDSCLSHIASGFDIPLITLFGPTTVKNHGPYFGNKNHQICIEGDRKGNKPSYNPNESPKTIDNIKPEEVARAVFKLLNINKEIDRESLYFGPNYTAFTVDVIMDSVIRPDAFPGLILNARLDYFFDENVLAQNLSLRQYSVVTEKPININILKQFSKNIPLIVYNIDENYDINFVKELTKAGLPYRITSFLENESLNKIKLDFFDYGLILNRNKIKKEDILNSDKITEKTKYKTNKYILSKDKIFLNKLDWQGGKNTDDFSNNISNVIDCAEFFEESDYFYFFNE